MHKYMHKYMHKLDAIRVLKTDVSHQENTAFRKLVAQVGVLVNRVLPHVAYSVSKTAQNPEGEWSATDVRDPFVTFRQVCLESIVVITTFDASFTKERK